MSHRRGGDYQQAAASTLTLRRANAGSRTLRTRCTSTRVTSSQRRGGCAQRRGRGCRAVPCNRPVPSAARSPTSPTRASGEPGSPRGRAVTGSTARGGSHDRGAGALSAVLADRPLMATHGALFPAPLPSLRKGRTMTTEGRGQSGETPCCHGQEPDRVCTSGAYCSCGCPVCRPLGDWAALSLCPRQRVLHEPHALAVLRDDPDPLWCPGVIAPARTPSSSAPSREGNHDLS